MRRNPRLHRNVLVQRHLSEIFVRESSDPRFQRVTVSRVEASKDMSFAKVFVSVFPSEGKAELVESLNQTVIEQDKVIQQLQSQVHRLTSGLESKEMDSIKGNVTKPPHYQ